MNTVMTMMTMMTIMMMTTSTMMFMTTRTTTMMTLTVMTPTMMLIMMTKLQENDLLCGNKRRHTVLTKVDTEIFYLHRQVSASLHQATYLSAWLILVRFLAFSAHTC